MKLLKAIFSLPFFLHITVGILLLIGAVYGLYHYLNFYTQHDKKIEIPDISKLNLFDAMLVLDNAGLKYEIDSFKFNPLHKPYDIIDIYPKIGSYVKNGRRIFLVANPKTYSPITVPNLIDSYKLSAYGKLASLNLAVGDTIYIKHKYRDVVLEMRYKNKKIEPGDEIPRFSKIDLVIGKPLDKNVTVPSFIGMSLNDAKRLLHQEFFELGRLDYTTFKDSTNARVFYQSPQPYDIYDQGSQIDFWLSDMPADSLSTKISELDNIYNRKIKSDSLGNVNFKVQTTIEGNVSKDVRRMVNTGSNGTKKEEKKKPIEKPRKKAKKPTVNSNEGIDID